jgi:hypothetical protein
VAIQRFASALSYLLKAGLPIVDSLELIMEPLETPTIIDYPQKVSAGESFLVKGAALPNEAVTLWSQQGKEDPQNITATSNAQGTFVANFQEGLKDSGRYAMWAVVTDQRSAMSLPSEKVFLQVERPALLKLGSWATTVLAVVVPLVAMLLVLIGLLWFAWQKFNAWRKKIRKEVKEAEQALHKAIVILKRDLAEQVRMLEHTKSQRELTEEEEKILELLQNEPFHFDEIVRRTKFNPSKLGSLLSMMEIKGLIKSLDGGLYSI